LTLKTMISECVEGIKCPYCYEVHRDPDHFVYGDVLGVMECEFCGLLFEYHAQTAVIWISEGQ